MLSSTKPRSHQPRNSHTSSSISSPPVDIPPSDTIPATPPSNSTPTPGARRPSISTTMHWLSRSTTQHNTPYTPSKPVKISEPKLVRGIDTLAHPRNGALGTGATVVRTPDEALRETGIRLTFDGKNNETPRPSKPRKEKKASISKTIGHIYPVGAAFVDYSAPNSPPLPPLPVPESDEEHVLSRSSTESERSSPKRPTGAAARPSPAPVPRSPSLRPSLKIRSTISSEDVVPPLPSAVPAPSCPPFKPILMSEVPSHPVDSEKVIVTIETCTVTYKTSLETLRSRPSNLSKYIDSLLSPQRTKSSTSSVYSESDSDHEHMTVYRQHLASQGLLPQPFYNIHLFLDRPSSPYGHILTYLRSPPAPEHPECIPRAIMYQQSTGARLESLIELRDEAAYLKLDALHKLCVDEIRKGHAPKMHARGNSTSGQSINSVHSMQASLCTMQTLPERVEPDTRVSLHSLGVSKSERDLNSLSDQSTAPSSRGPPTPHSWENGFAPGHMRNRSLPATRPPKNPPPGWI
ncbi:hypothetical protein CC1G_00352 [Coprinopsis cinerea okayama7|uniref:BTB domain-containing protein n=1 Tax=Coprinopsis cinerea (strain Okayama-7 / 130 / ATCC MYA-4618 / FGSC 9003) TaxID=240176 RepID=A8NXN1_COPC7|nr:hypothetical protein CC1G_00352 [Coprinopsis cinerea okayama7\|eukprot:XP_001837216.2 hypothetical protein CC1G_00352 [Coprinopsis cinerea okayama7\